MSDKITFVCVTQNRINSMKRMMPKVIDYVDRAVIVDGFSVDGTKEWLESFSPKVFVTQRKWDDSFANQYNEYLKHIGEGWVLLCYDKNTEVLTNDGWKFFKDLNKKEKVLTINPSTKNLEFQSPTKYISYRYNDKIFEYNGKSCSFSVTKKHNMFASLNNNRDSTFKLIPIEDVIRNKKARFLTSGTWIGISPVNDIVPGIENKTLMKILGWYISEGWTCKQDFRHKIYISQVKEDGRKEIIDLIKSIGRSPIRDNDHTFVFYHRALFDFLVQFGSHAKEKRITSYVKSLSPSLLSELLESYLLGDGSGGNVFTTVSEKLANDIQEICVRLGYRSCLKKSEPRIGGFNKLGKQIIGKLPIFTGTITRHSDVFIYTDEIIEKDYNDDVFCVTVPNHTICTRRNGRVMFCGNCDDDEIPSEDLLKAMKDIIKNSDNGRIYSSVEFKCHGMEIDKDGKILMDPGPCEYYRLIFYLYQPGMKYMIDLHQSLVGYKNGRSIRRQETYYHLKTNEDMYRNACRNWWIAGVWLPNATEGIRVPEWHELKSIVLKAYPDVRVFGDFNAIMVKGNMDQTVKDYLIKTKDIQDDEQSGRLLNELRAYYKYYLEMLHPEEAIN